MLSAQATGSTKQRGQTVSLLVYLFGPFPGAGGASWRGKGGGGGREPQWRTKSRRAARICAGAQALCRHRTSAAARRPQILNKSSCEKHSFRSASGCAPDQALLEYHQNGSTVLNSMARMRPLLPFGFHRVHNSIRPSTRWPMTSPNGRPGRPGDPRTSARPRRPGASVANHRHFIHSAYKWT